MVPVWRSIGLSIYMAVQCVECGYLTCTVDPNTYPPSSYPHLCLCITLYTLFLVDVYKEQDYNLGNLTKRIFLNFKTKW